MAQTQIVRGVATAIRTEGGTTHVRYHRTDIVSFDGEMVTLRSGGWETATTKARMNQASHQFNLGYQVYAKRHTWYVTWLEPDGTAETCEFEDGMRIPRTARRWTGEAWVPARAVAREVA